MSNPSSLSTTPPDPSRSPSSASASDRDTADAAEEESASDSDFLDAEVDLTPASPALTTRPTSSSWPYPPPLSPLSIPSSSLPHEILLHILRLLPPSSLAPALLVCKAWTQCGVELLWHKPSFGNLSTLYKMVTILDAPATETTFPYPSFVRRLNFSGLQEEMSDRILGKFVRCERLERLTIAGCGGLSSEGIVGILEVCRQLVAIDFSDGGEVDDEVVEAIARCCPKTQGLNLSSCKKITDKGIEALARGCPLLRRIKLRHIELLTDTPIILLSLNCPVLLEVDLLGCTRITSLALTQLFRTSHNLRELSLQSCIEITDAAFPDATVRHRLNAREEEEEVEMGDDLVATDGSFVRRPRSLREAPRLRQFDHLRYLDLTSLSLLTDASIAGIVKYMPRIRNLILAKCTGLTDDAVLSICALGKHLHYLHLGHVSGITDGAVTKLARACTRLRYIDLACCQLLTDMSVFELAANLPRLKRIGLVRVVNLTDEAIYALFARTSLERLHLSYCDNLSVPAIHELLTHLPRLTHLSLTGVTAFRRPDLQAWCRTPPRDFNTHQRASFCVYSGKGVQELRRFLRGMNLDGPPTDPSSLPTLQHLHPRHARAGAGQLQPIPPHNPNLGNNPNFNAPRQPPHPNVLFRQIPQTNNPTIPLPPRARNPLPQIPAFAHPVPVQAVPPPTNAAPAPNGWTWDQGTNSGSFAGRTRPRGATVTRGNFLAEGEVEMEEGSEESEEDVEMR